MSKRQKRLQKIRQNPKAVSFDDLSQLLQDYGFELDRVSGSHHVFEYDFEGKRLNFVVPFRRSVKAHYVREALRLIDLMGQDESEDESDE